jgi:hypothetical protein
VWLGALLGGLCWGTPTVALDHVRMVRDGHEQRLAGRVLVTAADGGLLLQTADGALWSILPEELQEHTQDDAPFVPMTGEEIGQRLLAELPDGFRIYQTSHYVICYNTSRAYAQWCGGLLERLFQAFNTYWEKAGFELKEPEFPLVACVFADRGSYEQQTQRELGQLSAQIIGYYSFQTNRVTMYDLTGIEALRNTNGRRGSVGQINLMLSQPAAEQAVATVIHEATHQIAFNSGFQTRYADIPLWVSEGIATYFESPDLKSQKGWRTLGRVNRMRLARFRQFAAQRPPGALTSLVADDRRLRDPRQAEDAYAESWALTYYLLKHRGEDFRRYLTMLSQKPPMVWNTPAERLREFEEYFGATPDEIEKDLLRFIGRLDD